MLDETDQAILAGLAGGKRRLTSEIANAIGLTSRATRTRLARMVGRGLGAGDRHGATGPEAALLPGQPGTDVKAKPTSLGEALPKAVRAVTNANNSMQLTAHSPQLMLSVIVLTCIYTFLDAPPASA